MCDLEIENWVIALSSEAFAKEEVIRSKLNNSIIVALNNSLIVTLTYSSHSSAIEYEEPGKAQKAPLT